MSPTNDPTDAPSDICLFSTHDVYSLVQIPSVLIPSVERHIHAVYTAAAFPDVFFGDIPGADIDAAVASLENRLSSLLPSVIPQARWLAEWALWRTHTALVREPLSGAASTATEVYALLRVSDPVSRTVLQCTNAVYKTAGIPDVRFSRIPEDLMAEAVKRLRVRLAKTVPDMRRGEGWFARWALGRRHTSRVKRLRRVERAVAVAAAVEGMKE